MQAQLDQILAQLAQMQVQLAQIAPIQAQLDQIETRQRIHQAQTNNMELRSHNHLQRANQPLVPLVKERPGHPPRTGYVAAVGDTPAMHNVRFPANRTELLLFPSARINELAKFYNEDFGGNRASVATKRNNLLTFICYA
eukprot:TRINITY_DN6655_c0_g1_i1.p1 TRINITY_DN6655_c0_g1~~TRINITY_DN6655_c0_g1_i1.p1  ORF type:complete len:140 (-),score=16.82 TRINITY_DN6655_c0_g1_i1:13-432(-)